MDTSGNTVLITGGATGIGLALAEAFVRAGSEVLICGRRENRLREARRKCPPLATTVCDVASEADRIALRDWATASFPDLNVLVNNAGIQELFDFTEGSIDLGKARSEMATNLEAPIHLSALFIPHLAGRPESAIVNVSSGLAFVPLAGAPVYSATKAALHSFSLSLRHQLSGTSVKVFEVVPPLVATELHDRAPEGRKPPAGGIAPEEVAAATLRGMAEDEFEIAVGMAQVLREGSRDDPVGAFERLNQPR